MARLHHIASEPVQLAHRLGWPPSHQADNDDILVAAGELGLKARLSRATPERLSLASLPALALMADDAGGRYVVVLAQCDGKRVLFQDPSGKIQGGRPVIESLASFAMRWSGELILLTSRASVAGELRRFDFSWFIPSLVKYRRLFGEVLVVSLFLQLFALVSPLFFQVVMDKVLVHRGLTTLDVLVVGLAVILLFESVLTILRTYVFSHTTSRIDVELGARLFRHLLHLPLSYFQARRVGDSVARVRELENIRSFLTGNALTLLLDVVFSVVFIAVMFIYSVPLTLIVLVTLPLYVALSLVVVPILRARLNEKFARGAENQALLVEAVTGIQTVKASALEPAIARRWDSQLAAYLFGRGSGADTIWAYELNSNKVDVLQMASGIATSDVQLRQQGSDLLVNLAGSGDSVRVMNHFGPSGYQIDQIRFADGTTWNVGAIRARLSGSEAPAGSEAMSSIAPMRLDAERAAGASSFAQSDVAPAGRLSLGKLILLNDDSFLSSWADEGPGSIWLPPRSPDIALIESRVQGLIDAMATFSAPAGDTLGCRLVSSQSTHCLGRSYR